MILNQPNSVIVGVGSALVDILIAETDEFLAKTKSEKGGMFYVESEQIDAIMSKSDKEPKIVPGGSACNTIVGISQLGGSARFVGKCGNDASADIFENGLKTSKVEPNLIKSDQDTGRVLSVITEDAQRTMFTFLGAAAELLPSEIESKLFKGAALVHVEGYLIHNKELILKVMNVAKSLKLKISMDLSSFTIVEQERDFLAHLVEDYIDILIANEDEAFAYTQESDELTALSKLSEKVEVAVLKIGSRGSYISKDSHVYKIEPATGGAIIDTTGAGDLWAAGFLFGLANGWGIEKSGYLGSLCGYKVCQTMGAHISSEGWDQIKTQIG